MHGRPRGGTPLDPFLDGGENTCSAKEEEDVSEKKGAEERRKEKRFCCAVFAHLDSSESDTFTCIMPKLQQGAFAVLFAER